MDPPTEIEGGDVDVRAEREGAEGVEVEGGGDGGAEGG